MQHVFSVLARTGINRLKLLSHKLVSLLLHAIKHPINTTFFIVKLYLSLLLLVFFLTASFSTLAHEVPAQFSSNATIAGPIMSPLDIRGRPFSTAKSSLIEGFVAGNMSSVTCNETASTPTSIDFSCDMINGYSGNPRHVDTTVSASEPSTYTCPPIGYSDHTVLNGTMCNTPTGEHENEPEPLPELRITDCASLAGQGADFSSFVTEAPMSVEDREGIQCSDWPTTTQQYKNACHILNNGGWTESEELDAFGEPTGQYRYTSINGTFSGFGCDANGNPSSGEDKYCTVVRNTGLKRITCPDGTTMSVPWDDFLAVEEAFLNHRQTTTSDIYALQTDVENIKDEVTTDKIVAALSTDEAFKASVKGDDGEPCTVQRLSNNTGIYMSCGGSSTNIYDGSKGATGASGTDGESCVAVESSDGVKITCKSTTANLKNGEDGEGCTTSGDGSSVQITCGATVSNLEVDSIDEGGIIAAIDKQTSDMTEALSIDGAESASFVTSDNLNDVLGAPNDYTVRNYGSVMENAVNEMKEAPLFEAVDGFFEVSFSGSCPTYSANVPFMNYTVIFDQWCGAVMDTIWPMVSAVIMIGFSFLAFRVAVL